MLTAKFIVSSVAILATGLTIDAAVFRCDRNWKCHAIVSTNNEYDFSRGEGCTTDGRYCSHVTNNDITDIKIWIRNDNVGCVVEGNFDQWIFGC